MADGTEPIGVALIVCEEVRRDPVTGRLSLIGVFSSVIAPEFPAIIPRMALYGVLRECKGSVPLDVRIIDAREVCDPVILLSGATTMPSEPLDDVETHVQLNNLVFPEPGEYRVELMTNGVTIVGRRIVLHFRPQR